MATVYVLNKDGKPLMPTTRCGHIRHLLKEKKARVVRTNPFTIKLVYETDDVRENTILIKSWLRQIVTRPLNKKQTAWKSIATMAAQRTNSLLRNISLQTKG